MLVTKANFKEACDEIKQHAELIVDTETTGLKILEGSDMSCGIGIGGLDSTEEWYFPTRMEKYKKNITPEQLKIVIGIISKAKAIINQNLKFDIRVLSKDGLKKWTQIEMIDLMPMQRLCFPEKFPDMDLVALIERLYGGGMADFDLGFKKYLKANKFERFSQAKAEIISEYCCKQVFYCKGIYKHLKKILEETKQTRIWKLEIETTMSLLEMEFEGVDIDLEYCVQARDQIVVESTELKKKAWAIAGEEFNLQSSTQISRIMNSMGIHSPIKTPTGKEAWNDAAVSALDNPLASTIREHRTLEKLRNTYFDPFIDSGGRIYCNFCNWRAITGRLSCSHPNLQNIPRFMKILGAKVSEESEKTKYIKQMMAASAASTTGVTIGGSSSSSWAFTGDESYNDETESLIAVRRSFITEPGYTLYCFDFSQMEIRVLLSYISGGQEVLALMQDKENPLDFHAFMAKQIYAVDETHPDFKFFRQMSKGITFGLIYGMSLKTMAQSIGKDKNEARILKQKYFEKLEGIEEFILQVQETVRERGYIFNKYGRRYYLDAQKAYVGVNYLIQGTTADLVKERMNDVVKELRACESKVLVQIHDELLCKIKDTEALTVVPLIVDTLERNAIIPLKVDVAMCSPSWAHKREIDLNAKSGPKVKPKKKLRVKA